MLPGKKGESHSFIESRATIFPLNGLRDLIGWGEQFLLWIGKRQECTYRVSTKIYPSTTDWLWGELKDDFDGDDDDGDCGKARAAAAARVAKKLNKIEEINFNLINWIWAQSPCGSGRQRIHVLSREGAIIWDRLKSLLASIDWGVQRD